MASRKRRARVQLPSALFALPNADKDFHEAWTPERDMLDFIHPFRALFLAKPNGGKTTAGKNVVLRVQNSDRPFEKIVVVHKDAETTQEYKDIEPEEPDAEAFELLSTVPAIEQIDGSKKTLFILEDLDFHIKATIMAIENLFRYGSTHKNVSVMVMSQNPFGLTPTIRRCANIIVIWNNRDGDMLRVLAKKIGVDSTVMARMVEKWLHKPHDSMWFDFTDNSPYPVRLNGYHVLSWASRNDLTEDTPLPKRFKSSHDEDE